MRATATHTIAVISVNRRRGRLLQAVLGTCTEGIAANATNKARAAATSNKGRDTLPACATNPQHTPNTHLVAVDDEIGGTESTPRDLERTRNISTSSVRIFRSRSTIVFRREFTSLQHSSAQSRTVIRRVHAAGPRAGELTRTRSAQRCHRWLAWTSCPPPSQPDPSASSASPLRTPRGPSVA